jgi:hypothetical protein
MILSNLALSPVEMLFGRGRPQQKWSPGEWLNSRLTSPVNQGPVGSIAVL